MRGVGRALLANASGFDAVDFGAFLFVAVDFGAFLFDAVDSVAFLFDAVGVSALFVCPLSASSDVLPLM